MLRHLITAPGKLRLWVGVFGIVAPKRPDFYINDAKVPVLGDPVCFEVRDRKREPKAGSRALNHQGVFELDSPGQGADHQIIVRLDGAETSIQGEKSPLK